MLIQTFRVFTRQFLQTLVVPLLVFGLAVGFLVPQRASAQSTAEIQSMIDQLRATIAALEAQLGTTSPVTGVCPYVWTRSLGVGTSGVDVERLQRFLNSDPDTRLRSTGVGSPGLESTYYGPLTANAVAKFQAKYWGEVLAPLGLVNPTGYFGPSTQRKANALCAASTPEPGEEDADEDSSDSMTLSGEASLDRFTVSSGDDSELEEGQTDVPVAEVDVEFVDGDALINRLEVSFVAGGANEEDDPWDTFDTVSLWVEGDMVGEIRADDRDAYRDEDNGTLRFTGLDIFAAEDDELTISIAVSVLSSVDGTNDGEDWTMTVDSMRFFDADRVAVSEDSGFDFGEGVTFTIEAEGAQDELVVRSSKEDPDSSTFVVEESRKSDWYTVFVFDLDTDDSTNDILLDTIPVTLTLGSTTVAYATIVDDAELVVDGVTIRNFDVSDRNSHNPVLTFDVDGDVEIDAGDRVTAELTLRFRSLDEANEGITVKSSITPTNVNNIEAEGADDLNASQLQGAASGEIHVLRTKGADVSSEDVSATVSVTDGATNDYATYRVRFEVTAFEQDAYIPLNPASSTVWSLEDGAGASVPAGLRIPVISSTAREQGNYFVVDEGSTETFTLTVTYVPETAMVAARLQLEALNFAPSAIAPTQTWTAAPDTDYRTPIVVIVN